MSQILKQRIEFAVVIRVEGANPNGDPLFDNRPRQKLDGRGEISDVAIKRKMRNALSVVLNQNILIQADGLQVDEHTDIKSRLNSVIKLDSKTPTHNIRQALLDNFFDVRAFGYPYTLEKKRSFHIRGPVTIRQANSVDKVSVVEQQITKSTNSKDKDGMTSDRMGMKYFVEFGVYVAYGSITPQLARKTGFTESDAELIKQSLLHMFDVDASSARPAGSMNVEHLFWWRATAGNALPNVKTVHESLHIEATVKEPKNMSDYKIKITSLENVVCERYGTGVPTF